MCMFYWTIHVEDSSDLVDKVDDIDSTDSFLEEIDKNIRLVERNFDNKNGINSSTNGDN